MKSETPKYFNQYGLDFCYFSKYLLLDLKKADITATVYYTMYSKHFNRELTNAEKNKQDELKKASDVYKKKLVDDKTLYELENMFKYSIETEELFKVDHLQYSSVFRTCSVLMRSVQVTSMPGSLSPSSVLKRSQTIENCLKTK